MPKKKTERQKAIERADKYASIYTRIFNADKNGYINCCTCGDRGFWEKDIICNGHFMPKGVGASAVRWLLHNQHGQCSVCNTNPNVRMKGLYTSKKGETSMFAYTRFMDEKYGKEITDDLKARKFQIANYTVEEIQEIGTLFNELAKIERKNKGL